MKRNMNLTFRIFLLLMLAIFMAACVPDSKNPLTAFDRDAMDASVYGSWSWKDDEESGYLHFGQQKKSGILQLMMVELNSNGRINVTQLLGHTSQFGNKRYLNLKFVPPDKDLGEYIIMKYEVSEKGLGLSFMDPSVIEKAIVDHTLAGSVEQKGHASSVHLSATSKKLRQFVRENDKRLFPEMKFLPRLYN